MPKDLRKHEMPTKKECEAGKAAFMPKFEHFLLALRAGSKHRAALFSARLDWSEVRMQMAFDKELAARHVEAVGLRDDLRLMERNDEIHSRAVEGYQEPVVSAGKEVCQRTVKSDSLLALLYRADHPDKFVQNVKSDVTVSGEMISGLLAKLEQSRPTVRSKKKVEG